MVKARAIPVSWYAHPIAKLEAANRIELLVQRLGVEVGKARNGQNVSHRAVTTNAEPKTSHQTLPLLSMDVRGKISRYFLRVNI